MVSKVSEVVNILGSELALAIVFTVYWVKLVTELKHKASEWGAWSLGEMSHLCYVFMHLSAHRLVGKEWKGTWGIPSGKECTKKIIMEVSECSGVQRRKK